MFTASWHHSAWTVRAFHKRIFRAPTLNDLYYTLVEAQTSSRNTPHRWDIGTDYRAHGLHIALDFYHNRITDKIVAIPAKSQFRWSMVNFGLVKSLGLSATAGYDYLPGQARPLSKHKLHLPARPRLLSTIRPRIPQLHTLLAPAFGIGDSGSRIRRWQIGASWLYTGNLRTHIQQP